ncbi:hybrid sensor histidine kinase/response regulator [Candidatus Venteria ishoeyi]|uniref:sensor histidine kinase n=1 Tax=Candidatus Venteria ishoeyi TaxID=1899563 RepID=UPI0025A5AF62|nr:hybrid sensor histidine kinase/response regulator [Candidatus Venteria ishoeyi]MDM8545664.1 hybrid sensor histidine kinase/response regulator [Candidatus Venteria ishoeyi]
MPQETILLVDDQPENIAVLHDFLAQLDYKLVIAEDGETALSIVKQKAPDLILLDVMMPGTNGFEVCRQIKDNKQLREIPVIFITALVEVHDKVQGFEVGGVDYITKPFQREEVLARVRAHLTITRQRQELQQKNQELDAFAHTVAHDLKNTLSAIGSHAELIKYTIQNEGNLEQLPELADFIFNSAYKASDIIEALLLLAGSSLYQNLLIEPFDMAYVIKKVQIRMKIQLAEASITLKLPEQWTYAQGYPAWVEEIWFNYISNALKYGGKPPQIELGQDELENSVRFWVRDNGPGLTKAQQAKLFVPFTRLHTDRAEGHGLGLSIVQRIAERLGGNAGVDSIPGQGSLFYFVLPK